MKRILEPHGKVTICVLLYGTDGEGKDIRDKSYAVVGPNKIKTEMLGPMSFHELHKRCIGKILETTPRESFRLCVGCNEVDEKTTNWLNEEVSREVELIC